MISERGHRSVRSPTARANRPQYDAEIYVDFDSNQATDSPFLIPPELNDQVQERLQRSALNNTSDYNPTSDTHQNTIAPSAPLADHEIHEINETRASTRANRNILEPVLASSLSTSSTSSLGFGASLTEAIAASELVSHQAQTSATLVASVITDSMPNLNSCHFPDEQPPSYDEIIKQRKY